MLNLLKYKYIFTLIVILSGLVYFQFDLLVPCLVFSFAICTFCEIIMHEYWEHSYYTPKNKIIKVVIDTIGLMYTAFMASRVELKSNHVVHHKYWKQDLDITHYNMQHAGKVKHLIFGHFSLKPGHWFILKKYTKLTNKLTSIELLFDQYRFYIITAITILIIGIFSFKIWFYFCLIPAYLFYLYIVIFSELLPHAEPTINEEKDRPWLFPLIFNLAYHKRHHAHQTEIFFGPGIFKYINPQYYFVKLFFN